MVAAGVGAHAQQLGLGFAREQRRERALGVRGARAGVDPQHLEIGERGAELLRRDRSGALEVDEHGHDVRGQPHLLAVRAQQQSDVVNVGILGTSIRHLAGAMRHRRSMLRGSRGVVFTWCCFDLGVLLL